MLKWLKSCLIFVNTYKYGLKSYINLIITQMMETFPELFSTGEVIIALTFNLLLSIDFKHVFSLFPNEIHQHHQPGLQPCITRHSDSQCSLSISYSFNGWSPYFWPSFMFTEFGFVPLKWLEYI